MRLKILCIYYDEELQFLDTGPEEALSDHEVVVARSFAEANVLLSNATNHFDIVLSDVYMPIDEGRERETIRMIRCRLNSQYLIRGLGLFLPDYWDREVIHVFDRSAVTIESHTCWDYMEHRDWNKLLKLVLEGIKQNVR